MRFIGRTTSCVAVLAAWMLLSGQIAFCQATPSVSVTPQLSGKTQTITSTTAAVTAWTLLAAKLASGGAVHSASTPPKGSVEPRTTAAASRSVETKRQETASADTMRKPTVASGDVETAADSPRSERAVRRQAPRNEESVSTASVARIENTTPPAEVKLAEQPASSGQIATTKQTIGKTRHIDRIAYFAHKKDGQKRPNSGPGTVKMGLSVILKLALVLVLAYFSLLALKLLSSKRQAPARPGQDLKVVDTIKLTQTNSLHVVEINGKKMLVGSSAGQVNLLREFEEEEIQDVKPETEGHFAQYLSKYSGTSFEKTPAGRVAGLLRDCADHLKTRRQQEAGRQTVGEMNEA